MLFFKRPSQLLSQTGSVERRGSFAVMAIFAAERFQTLRSRLNPWFGPDRADEISFTDQLLTPG